MKEINQTVEFVLQRIFPLSFELTVNEPLSKVQDQIRSNLGPKRSVFSSQEDAIFNGSVEEMTFKIQRNIYYRDPFDLTIYGKMECHPNGTKIIANMKLPDFMVIFVPIWTAGVLFAPSVGIWKKILFISGALAITYFGFCAEAKNSKEALQGILKLDS